MEDKILKRVIEGRTFCIDVCREEEETRGWFAHRIRNARRYLREFVLDEPEKIVHVPKKVLDFPGSIL